MKNIINKFLNHIFLYDFIYLGICIILSMLLYICDMRFRLWVYVVLVVIFGLLLLVGLIRQFIKKKLIGLIFLIGMTVLAFVCGPFLLFVLAFSYNPEHVVELEGDTYVATVKSFIDVDVYYYDYYGPLLMGTKVRAHGYFGEGGFDPFENPEKAKKVEYTFYDKYGNIEANAEYTLDGHLVKKETTTTTNALEIREEDKFKLEDAQILYEIKFGKLVKRFVVVDYALGQNYLAMVAESKDGGKTFNIISKGFVEVSSKAEFVFLDENMGFANKYKYIYYDSPGMYVTNDGGITFNMCEIKYKSDRTDHITMDGEPYIEDGKLKLKCREYLTNEKYDELIFISEDKGITWELEK